MKPLLPTVFLFTLSLSAFSQSISFDALTIVKKTKLENGQLSQLTKDNLIFEMLDSYIDPLHPNTKSEIIEGFKSNPFFTIKGSSSTHLDTFDYMRTSRSKVTTDITYKYSDLSDLQFSQYIIREGIIIDKSFDFLAEKLNFTQKHLIFLSNFKEEFINDTILQKLFPSTFKVLAIIGDNISEIQSYYRSLRVAFHEDFTSMAYNLPAFIQSSDFDKILSYRYASTEKESIKSIVASNLEVIKRLSYNGNPADFFDCLGYAQSINAENKDYFILTSIISKSIQSKVSSYLWEHENTLIDLFSSKEGFTIYLGLMYQVFKNHSINESVLSNFVKIAKSDSSQQLKHFIGELSIYSQGVEQIYNDINKDINLERNKEYYRRINILFEKYLKLSSVLVNNTRPHDTNDYIQKYISINFDLSNLFLCFNAQNYTKSATTLGILFSNPIIRTNYSLHTSRVLIKYGDFMASVIGEKNQTSIDALLDYYAVSVKRSEVKFTNKFVWCLNLYTGLFYSPYIFGNIGRDSTSFKRSAGTSIAIGPSFTKSYDSWKKTSLSLFFPMVDIGLLGVYSFNGDSLAIAKTSIRNFINPGVMLALNRPKGLPFSIVFGIQKQPISFQFIDRANSLNGDYIDKTWRYRIMIAYDLPLIIGPRKPKNPQKLY
ncbi:MAG: hypothetical protein ACO1PI_10070 [Bacteroidota bacterium]